MSDERAEFSVAVFFEDGAYEYARRYVHSAEAFEAFVHLTTSVGARIGTTERVIITDGGDSTCAEWIYGKGMTYPPEAVGKEPRPDWEARMR